MKRLLKRFVQTFSLILPLGALCAEEYQDRVMEIAKAFSNSDPEAQYTARRNLEILVSQATAPERLRGAAKITDDLLYALDLSLIHI